MSLLLRRRLLLGKKEKKLYYTLTDTTGDGKKDLLELSTKPINSNSVDCSWLLTAVGYREVRTGSI